MTYRPNGDYGLQVAKGDIAGEASFNQRGRRAGVSTGGFDDITALAATAYPFLQAAAAVRIRAGGNANDTAAGTGARSVLIEGLDNNLNQASETIVTAGAAASALTTTTWWRINNVSVVDVGTYQGTAAADIQIETAAGVILSLVSAFADVSQLGIISVPAGKDCYIKGVDINVASSKTAQVRFVCRERLDVIAAPMAPRILLKQWEELQGEIKQNFQSYIRVPAKSDIWFQAQSNTSAADIDVEMEGVFVTL
jgi:hypothetical protein